MHKIILVNNEFEIKEGASLENITVTVSDFSELGTMADALLVSGNLDTVKFTVDDEVNGEYSDMALLSPLFNRVDIVDGKVEATFGIREKTDTEKRLEALESGQEVQDGAIVELAEIIGGE